MIRSGRLTISTIRYTRPTSIQIAAAGPAYDSGSGSGEMKLKTGIPAPALYYARVLQVPTCRWTSFDALRLGRTPPASVPATIQERAVTSPIWIVPGGGAR